MSELASNAPMVTLLIAVNVVLAGVVSGWVNARLNRLEEKVDHLNGVQAEVAALKAKYEDIEKRLDRQFMETFRRLETLEK